MNPRWPRAEQTRCARAWSGAGMSRCGFLGLSWFGFEACAFELQQRRLARQATGVTGERRACPEYAVAGDDDTQGIAGHRASHGTHGCGLADAGTQRTVAQGGAERNLQQGAPDGLLKVSASR